MIEHFLSRIFVNQWAVLGLTTAGMLVLAELSYRTGNAVRRRRGDDGDRHSGSVQGAVLGLLGLMLGFSFAMAVGRHESRRELVVEEANSIGTTWLRADLLPASVRSETKALLKRYAETRLEAHETLKRGGRLDGLGVEIAGLHTKLWANAAAAAEEQPSPVTATFVIALNETIDLHSSRLAALHNRVPGMVWLLLLLVAACGAWTSGYGSGLRGHRYAFDLYTFPVLVGVVITIISDIDQPRRGLISVSQDPLQELLESMSP